MSSSSRRPDDLGEYERFVAARMAYAAQEMEAHRRQQAHAARITRLRRIRMALVVLAIVLASVIVGATAAWGVVQ